MLVGVDVTNEGSDSGQMEPMLDQLEQNFGQVPEELLVDGGFSSREDTTRVEQRGVKVYSPIKKEKQLLQEGKDPYARRPGDSSAIPRLRSFACAPSVDAPSGSPPSGSAANATRPSSSVVP